MCFQEQVPRLHLQEINMGSRFDSYKKKCTQGYCGSHALCNTYERAQRAIAFSVHLLTMPSTSHSHNVLLLLMCFVGEEQVKVELLSQRLAELGVDVEELLAGIRADDDDQEQQEEDLT
jgi:hypothetical protein